MTDEALESTVEPIEADAPVVDETPEAPPAFDEADAAEARALGWKSPNPFGLCLTASRRLRPT